VKANRKAKLLISQFPKDVRYFIEEVDEILKADGYTFYVSSGAFVKTDCGSCGGYFDSINRVLAVAGNVELPRFISLLCHEFNHFKQKNNPKSTWNDPKISDGHSKLFSWLSGHRHYRPDKLTQAAIALELECERMTLKMIRRRFSHIISPAEYSRRASIYLYGYLWVLETGRWFVKTPYQPAILAACEPVLKRKYTEIPPALRKAFEECL
jgi:hypothetical protein